MASYVPGELIPSALVWLDPGITPCWYDEVIAAKTMIDRTEQCMGLKPEHLAADTAYGTGKFLAWVVAKGIAPHIPVWDHSYRNDGTFSRDDFKFDKERNIYVCPTGKVLKTTGRIGD